MGDNERAVALAEIALDAAVDVGDVVDQLSAHNLLGVMAYRRGQLQEAEDHLGDAIRLAESSGLHELANTSRLNLGAAYSEAGRLDDAREHLRAVLHDRLQEGLSEGVGFAHLNLGETEYAAGELAIAEEHFTAASEAFRAVGFKARIANSLQGLAAVEARTGRAESAARRLGSAAALMADTGWGADGSDLVPAATSAAREVLGDEAFDRLFSEGAAPGST
jgi:tetratricopeptide (TPR) repeat protein